MTSEVYQTRRIPHIAFPQWVMRVAEDDSPDFRALGLSLEVFLLVSLHALQAEWVNSLHAHYDRLDLRLHSQIVDKPSVEGLTQENAISRICKDIGQRVNAYTRSSNDTELIRLYLL